MELKKRTEIHYARKIWHITAVFVMYLAYTYLPNNVSLSLLVIAWLLFVPFDVLRQKYPALNDFAIHAFRPIMRQNEVKKLAGTSFLLTGVLVVDVLFPRSVVSLTLLFLAFADPIASYFGILFGKDKIFGHKSIQGFVAAFLMCTLITLLYFFADSFLTNRLLVMSILAGLVGALSELIPIGKLDDNLTLPIISAMGLSVIFYFFGIFNNVG